MYKLYEENDNTQVDLKFSKSNNSICGRHQTEKNIYQDKIKKKLFKPYKNTS